MAIVKPFKAIRPTSELADKVAALPYDVMNSEEARNMVKGNPYSFLHIDKADIDLDPSIDVYDKIVYEKARTNLKKMIEESIFIQDKNEYYYVYKQVMNERTQIGLVGCTSIDDYLNNIIKKHEYTRPDKELDRINHVDYCDANTGPIFLTYRANQKINEIINQWMAVHPPIYDFISEDRIEHTVWLIHDQGLINELKIEFAGIDSLYIADGHHRSASAVKVGLKRREQMPKHSGTEEFNFFLSVLFPDEQLYIMDYNRVVKDLNGHTEEQFIAHVSQNFTVETFQGAGQYKPEQKHTFGMFLSGKWYKLTAKDGTYSPDDPVQRLDVSILQNNLLKPVLGIEDPRIDKKIDFVGGIRGLKELEQRVIEGGMKVAFSMYPTTIDDLMSIADAGEVMPPKSTWFEPKLRSGLFIHELS